MVEAVAVHPLLLESKQLVDLVEHAVLVQRDLSLLLVLVYLTRGSPPPSSS